MGISLHLCACVCVTLTIECLHATQLCTGNVLLNVHGVYMKCILTSFVLKVSKQL
jgi:hypothetical protein